MIKLTLNDAFACAGALRALLAQPVPIQTAYRLTKIADALDAELRRAQDILNERRDNALGQEAELSPESKAELEAMANELLREEITVDGDKIDLGVLGTQPTISANDLASLDWLIRVHD